MIILDTFPTPDEFYATYWDKKPFAVRGYIDPSVFDDFIDGDTMAGLSLEEDVKSRIVTTEQGGGGWSCKNGPFADDFYETIGDENWGLLVQNVEQYHPDTADLLRHFNFSPRWLLDDIMVSYSTKGGTVGPHIDSYHVFLVQGIGKRTWTVGDEPIINPDIIAGLNLQMLKDDIKGNSIDTTAGDVIYIPPHFGHSGITIDTAMTFSVGFLGPKMSELLIEYGYYLEQCESQNTRYSARDMGVDSARFSIARNEQESIQNALIKTIQGDSFSAWLSAYFSTPTHTESVEMRDIPFSNTQMMERLKSGDYLYRPDHVKITITTTASGQLNLSAYGQIVPTSPQCAPLIQFLNENDTLALSDIDNLGGIDALVDGLVHLYNQNVLYFEDDELFD